MVKFKKKLSGFMSFLNASDLPNGKVACLGFYCGKRLAKELGFNYVSYNKFYEETDTDYSNAILTDLNYIPIQNINSFARDSDSILKRDGIITLIAFKHTDKDLRIDNEKPPIPWSDPSLLILLPKTYEDDYVNVYKITLYPEEFKCEQCGGCCTNISGGYMFTPTPRDIYKWREACRFDILEYCEQVHSFDDDNDLTGYDAWVSPVTHEDVYRCPFKRKIRNKDKYKCTIHEIKPDHCQIWFPSNEISAKKVKCKAWEKSPWKTQLIVKLCDDK